MKKLPSMLILAAIFLLLTVLIVACGGDDDNNSSDPSGSKWLPQDMRATEQAANATATYGAEILEIQLTAIADKKSLTGDKP